jgi:chromosome segregation ATPase
MNLPKSPKALSPLTKSRDTPKSFERSTKKSRTIGPNLVTTLAVAVRNEEQDVEYLKMMLSGTSKELERTEKELHRIREEFHRYRDRKYESSHSGDLNTLHKQLNNAVSVIDKSAQKLLKSQEKELIKFFNAKLNDLKTQFQAEKEAKINEILEISKQGCEAANELNTLRITVHFIEQQNSKLIAENRALNSSLSQAKDELAFLTQRYTKLKQEKMRSSNDMEKLAHSLPNTPKNLPQCSSPVMTDSTLNLEDGKAKRNEIYIKNLQKALDIERENLKKLRKVFNQEVGETNQLRMVLKECLSLVQNQMIAARKEKRSDVENVIAVVDALCAKQSLFLSILEGLSNKKHVKKSRA